MRLAPIRATEPAVAIGSGVDDRPRAGDKVGRQVPGPDADAEAVAGEPAGEPWMTTTSTFEGTSGEEGTGSMRMAMAFRAYC